MLSNCVVTNNNIPVFQTFFNKVVTEVIKGKISLWLMIRSMVYKSRQKVLNELFVFALLLLH